MNYSLDYDAIIDKACPNYRKAHRLIAELVSKEAGETFLSIGTGTGNLEKGIVKKQQCVIAVDKDREALEKAERKFPHGNLYPVIRDLTQSSPLPPADHIISSLTLHHIPPVSIPQLAKRIGEALRPGGQFINYDIVKARTSAEQDAWVNYITSFMRTNGMDESFIAEEAEILRGRGEHADHPTTLETQRQALARTGMELQIHWRDHLFVVYSAKKA